MIPARTESQERYFVGKSSCWTVAMLVGIAEDSTGAVGNAQLSIDHVSLRRPDSPRARRRSYKDAYRLFRPPS